MGEVTERFSDIFLVAFLCTRGHEIQSTQRDSLDRTEFYFSITPELKEDISSYKANSQVLIPIRALIDMYKDLNRFVHNPPSLNIPRYSGKGVR